MNDLVLLAMLMEGPQHGYALKKKVGVITGHGDMHNNLVYPLLKRFVGAGWVSRRSARGQRGQTRELYSLTAKGKRELVHSLSEFGEKDAGSGDAFRFRVSLFPLLEQATRENILDRRVQWLNKREERLNQILKATGARGWSGEVIEFLKAEARAERRWAKRWRRKAAKEGAGKASV